MGSRLGLRPPRPSGEAAPADAGPPRLRRRRGGPARELAFLAGTLAATAAAVVHALGLWRASLGVPFAYVFDSLFHSAVVKGMAEQGWYLDNPRLGFPQGLELHDFPLGAENLHFVLLKGLTALGGDWPVALNAYYLAGFALVAVTAYVVLRQIGTGPALSLGLATLFAVLPYHFVVGQLQLFQATYFAVPLGALLVLDAAGWDVWRPPFLGWATDGGRTRWAARAVLCVVVGSSGSYYAPFTAVLVVVGAGLSLLGGGDRRRLRTAAGVVALLVGVVAANNAPTLRYRLDHGANAEVAHRPLGESDFWALRVVDLVLPVQGHRLPPFADVKERLDRFSPVSPVARSPQTPLGLAGATGLVVSLLAVARAARRRAPGPDGAGSRLADLGLLNAACILLAVSTGFSSLFALAGVTQLRAWSRLSVFIAFFSLAALGLAAQAALRRLGARRAGASRLSPAVAAVAGAVVLAGLVLDQTPARYVPAYRPVAETFENDRAFVSAVERRLPTGAAVFQLPLVRFPEWPGVASMLDYNLLRGYLHSTDLRWSYPAMRGRATDWTWSLGGRPLPEFLDAVAAAGFSGLYVDRSGFLDRARGLERGLGPLVGPAAVESSTGLAFWDLRPWAGARRDHLGEDGLRRARRLVLAPVVPRWPDRFGFPAGEPPAAVFGDFLPYPAVEGQVLTTERTVALPATLELDNPLPDARPVRLRFTVRSTVPDAGGLVVDAPGAPPVTVEARTERQVVEVDVVLPPGTTRVRLTGPPDDVGGYRVGNLVVTDTGG